jgi:hypothetical protein
MHRKNPEYLATHPSYCSRAPGILVREEPEEEEDEEEDDDDEKDDDGDEGYSE